MATTALVGVNTIMDVVNSYTSLDNKATYLKAAQILARKCPFFQDMPMKPSNQIFSNIGARQTYLPTPGTRRFNEGVAPTASHSAPYTESICMIEDWSEVDKVLCDIQNNKEQWRSERVANKMEAMGQKAEDQILYGALSSDPGGWDGLATRFNSTTRRPNGDSTWPYNVISAGGSTSATVTSIYIIGWGDGKIFGIYPPNLTAGITVKDMGEDVVNTNTEAAPKYMRVYRTFIGLYFGLNIEDERYVQRICNHEVSGDVNTFDPRLLITAINRIPDPGGIVIYANRTVKTQMDIYALDKSNGFYTQGADGDIFGRSVTMFQGHPVRLAEMIDDTETVVS